MRDLAEFLLARLAEDEENARACQNWSECGPDNWEADPEPGYGCPGHASVARQLANLDAKRQIVERACRAAESGANAMTTGSEEAVDWALEGVLRLLALPYADHRDYCAEWRP